VQDGTCRCSTTDDCNGIFDANCLPLSVYPPAQDCEAAAAPCDQLLGWSEGLRNAYIHHSGQGHGDLLPELGDCASRTAVARLECGEPACALLCELGDCDRHAEQTECIETCNAGDYTPAELAEVVDALARDPDSACACETCTATGSPVCAGLWGCE
jgi:hypothetical protein